MAAPAYDISQGRSLMPRGRGGLRVIEGNKKNLRGFDVKRRMEELQTSAAEKAQHENDWSAVFNLTMPDRNTFHDSTPGATKIPQELFDSYGLRAMRRGVGNLIGSMTPDQQQWARIVAGSGIPERRREAIAPGLERITKIFFERLGKSSFDSEAHTMGHDLMVSMGFLTMDPGNRQNPLRIQAIPITQAFPFEGPYGQIENCYRKYPTRPAILKREWPGLTLTPRLERMMRECPERSVEIVEATVYEEGYGFRFAIFDPADKSILYVVDPKDPFEPSRWITPRMYRRPGSIYGIGAAREALPTLRVMNKLHEIELKAGARFYMPPLLIDSLSGQNPHTMRLSPNAIGMFNGAALNGRPPFLPLPANGVPQWGGMVLSDMHNLVDDIMFASEVVGPAEDLKGVTATAVTVRKQQLLLQQGVDLGRLQREFPFAVMRRGIWCLSQLGIIDPPINIDDLLFSVDYLGPLAIAQKAERANNVLGFVSSLRSTVGDQAAALSIKIEDVGRIVGQMWPDVPQEMLRSEEESAQMQKQAAMIAAQQAAGAAGQPSMDPSNLPGAGMMSAAA